jgi:hypothetical protein
VRQQEVRQRTVEHLAGLEVLDAQPGSAAS